MENTEGSNNAYIIFYRLLEVLEDFRCVKDMHFLIYTSSGENTLTL